MIYRLIYPGLLALFLFIACDAKPTREPGLAPERFAQIYVEIVTHSINTTATDSTQIDSTDPVRAVLDSLNVSLEEFERSIQYYEDHPTLWYEIFSTVTEELKQKTPQ